MFSGRGPQLPNSCEHTTAQPALLPPEAMLVVTDSGDFPPHMRARHGSRGEKQAWVGVLSARSKGADGVFRFTFCNVVPSTALNPSSKPPKSLPDHHLHASAVHLCLRGSLGKGLGRWQRRPCCPTGTCRVTCRAGSNSSRAPGRDPDSGGWNAAQESTALPGHR